MTHSVCPQCGHAFTCGPQNREESCWCNELPAILPPDPEKGCLCRTCLTERTAAHIEKALHHKSHAEMLQLAASCKNTPPLIEYIDYTMENGKLVFTAWYHLKRGYCCGNGCRHCPFPKTENP